MAGGSTRKKARYMPSNWIQRWQLSACHAMESRPKTSVERMHARSHRFTFSFALRTGATSASCTSSGFTSLLPNMMCGSMKFFASRGMFGRLTPDMRMLERRIIRGVLGSSIELPGSATGSDRAQQQRRQNSRCSSAHAARHCPSCGLAALPPSVMAFLRAFGAFWGSLGSIALSSMGVRSRTLVLRTGRRATRSLIERLLGAPALSAGLDWRRVASFIDWRRVASLIVYRRAAVGQWRRTRGTRGERRALVASSRTKQRTPA